MLLPLFNAWLKQINSFKVKCTKSKGSANWSVQSKEAREEWSEEGRGGREFGTLWPPPQPPLRTLWIPPKYFQTLLDASGKGQVPVFDLVATRTSSRATYVAGLVLTLCLGLQVSKGAAQLAQLMLWRGKSLSFLIVHFKYCPRCHGRQTTSEIL